MAAGDRKERHDGAAEDSGVFRERAARFVQHEARDDRGRRGEAAGADVTVINLADFEMPLFNQDLEAEKGLPAAAVALKKLFIEHHGLLISCPEYNSSITPLLKNTIDWVSRPAPGEAALSAYKGKGGDIDECVAGALGGLRGLVTVRSILGNIGVVVLPEQIAVPTAHQAIEARWPA